MNPHEIFELLLPSPRHPLGAVVPSRNPATSTIEQTVRQRLLAAGVSVEQGWATQCGLDPFSGKFPVLTPDFIVKDTRVCVEVDPLYTHGRRVLHDVVRNALFTQVGWTVIRLRWGGQPPLGGYDVVTSGESITEEVITALVAAVTDAVAGQPAQVRRVGTTTATTTPAAPAQQILAQPILTQPAATASTPPSRLGTLTTRPRFDNAVFFTWQLDYGDKVHLALLDSGRYLGKNTTRGGVRFIRTTHFHTLPQHQWPAALEAALEQLTEAELAPVSPFPWGDRFFTGPCGQQVLVPSHLQPRRPGNGHRHRTTRPRLLDPHHRLGRRHPADRTPPRSSRHRVADCRGPAPPDPRSPPLQDPHDPHRGTHRTLGPRPTHHPHRPTDRAGRCPCPTFASGHIAQAVLHGRSDAYPRPRWPAAPRPVIARWWSAAPPHRRPPSPRGYGRHADAAAIG